MSLRSVNLNLIPILRAVLREKGVSRAARSLGLTQPTVSMALSKLRGVLRDPLLVQVNGSWELTVRGQELVDPVEEVCVALDAICSPGPYDPKSATGTVTIALPDAAAMIVGPPLVRELREQAPGLKLHFIDMWREFRTRQRSDEIDLMVTVSSVLDHMTFGDLRSAFLWHDRMVIVVGCDHPMAQSGYVRKDSEEGYAVYFPGLEPVPPESVTFFESYISGSTIAGRYQHCSVLALIAVEAGAVVKMPFSLACKLRTYLPIHIVSAGDDDPKMDVCLAWSPILDADPAHRWIRNMIITTLRGEALRMA